MPEYLKGFMSNKNEIKENFVKYIELEKGKVRDNMQTWLKEMEKLFSIAVQDVSKYLDTQCDRFEKNLDFFFSKINESFALNELPRSSDILQNLNVMNAVEADKYLQDINRVLKVYSKPLNTDKFEVLHKAILDNINNNLEFTVPPTAQKKWDLLLKNSKDNVTEITKDIVNNLKKKKISNLTKATDQS